MESDYEVGAWVPIRVAATLVDTPWDKKTIKTYRRWCQKQSMGKVASPNFRSRKVNNRYEVYIPNADKYFISQPYPDNNEIKGIYISVPVAMLDLYKCFIKSSAYKNAFSMWIVNQINIISINNLLECSSDISCLISRQRRIRLSILARNKITELAKTMKVPRKLLCTYLFLKWMSAKQS